jgi:hypothetical protein
MGSIKAYKSHVPVTTKIRFFIFVVKQGAIDKPINVPCSSHMVTVLAGMVI